MTNRATALLQKARKSFDGLPRTFWMLMLATFVDRLGGTLLFPFMGVYVAKHFNVTFTEVGIVFAISSISGLVGNGIAGALTDRFGRRSMMIAGLIISAFSTVVLGLVNDLTLICHCSEPSEMIDNVIYVPL